MLGRVGGSSLSFSAIAAIILLVYLLADVRAMEGHWIRIHQVLFVGGSQPLQ